MVLRKMKQAVPLLSLTRSSDWAVVCKLFQFCYNDDSQGTCKKHMLMKWSEHVQIHSEFEQISGK